MCNFDNMEDVDAADDNAAGCPVRRGAGSRQQEDK